MNEPADQIRRLIDSVEPISETEIRAQAAAGDQPAPTDDLPLATRTRPVLVGMGLVVVAVVVIALAVWSFGDDGSGSDDETVIAAGPPTTALAPVGDDPLVSCDPYAGETFRPSAWSSPTGAEQADDPAALALRQRLEFEDALLTANSVDPLMPIPTSPWRRLAESSDMVLFGAGEFDLEAIESDDMGPALTFTRVELVDGTWQAGGTSSGSCSELWVQPPPDQSVASWAFDPDSPPSPDSTELTIQVGPGLPLCAEPVTIDDLVGPDVVETADSVTIRVALDRPPKTQDDLGRCNGGLPEVEEYEPVEVTVELATELGERELLNGNLYPAEAVAPT